MAILLADYRCTGCGVLAELWMPSPLPASVPCPSCGAVATRRYGFRGFAAGGAVEPGGAGHGHDHPDGLGTCGLLPTAARALTARLRGDERGLEREFRQQERMISEGALDPAAGVHGVPSASAAPAAH